jgi:DNA-binding NtrC family response regulator
MKQDNEHAVYLIDDDALYLNAVEHRLQEQGRRRFVIKIFTTGEQCMKYMRESTPEIVVLDYYLHSQEKEAADGITVLKKIRNLYPTIQVIILSRLEKLDIAVNCLKSGAFDYVVKNESALIRIEHLINTILSTNELKKKVSTYQKWNLLIAGFFVLFLISLIIYAARNYQ